MKKKRWYITSFTNGKPSFWNSNKLSIDSAAREQKKYPIIYKFGDDVYALFNPKPKVFCGFRLANDGKFHKRLSEAYPSLKKSVLDWQNLPSISYGTTISTTTTSPSQKLNIWWLLLSSLLLFIAIFIIISNGDKIGIAAILGVFLFLSNLAAGIIGFTSLEVFFLTDSNALLSINNRDVLILLFNHLLLLSGIGIVVTTFAKKNKQFLVKAVCLGLLIFGLDLLLSLIKQVVFTSDISFDFEKLFGLSISTFAVIALFWLSFFTIWALLNQTMSEKATFKRILLAFAIGAAAFILFQTIDTSRNLISILAPVGILLIGLLASYFIKRLQAKHLSLFLLSILTLSILVHRTRQQREDDAVKAFANALIENKDPEAEKILQSVEDALTQEFLTPEDYANFIDKKEVIEDRIKRLYFSNYLEKYELKLLSFDPKGENVNANNIYSYEDLDNIYNSSSRTSSSHFLQITSSTGFSGYIAKYENCDIEGHYGTTYILLQPRIVQSEFLYPEAFANQEDQKVINLDDYSYGIYFKDKLTSQRGRYPYKFDSKPSAADNPIFYGFAHQLFENEGHQVVLSHRQNTLRTWLSSFTFSLLTLLPLTLLLALLAYLLLGPKNKFSPSFLPFGSKYISTRIQSSLTMILLFGLLLSVYIIINYIRSNYNENLENQLLSTVKNIGSQFQNKVDLERKLKNEEDRLLILNEESSTYKVDLNLFNKSGELLNSTKPYLLENEIIGDQMNPKAYSKLTLDKNSQLLIEEELEGSKYLSAYVPLFNGKNQVIGFLNTPYFAKNEELNKQISSLVVNIINIYFLLLIGAILLAYLISKRISKPLRLIQEKMSTTSIGHINEHIVYNRDDEIGQLVKQYNEMVTQLESSANQLAESEREGAWREMAKQVAHEIKNPLTPMKLSIQHLQRAYKQGSSEKLDALFQRTSKLLIEQIESLSNMASEFSTFAKMPEDKYETFDISEVLFSTIQLFERSENVQFKTDIQENKLVHADPEQIGRVFNNIIKNAIQAIPEDRKGMIDIRMEHSDAMLSIHIQDNGKGIEQDNYKKVFVPNFSTKNSGMGLGLAISKKIIETAGGQISFTSHLGDGTTFVVNLPHATKA